MDALLILGGLLLIFAGQVWLVMLAFGTSLLWGWGSLLPPLALLFVLRHWRVARKAVVLGALGLIPLIVGLTLLANKDPARLEAILSLRWLKPMEQAPAELNMRLQGVLNGQAFNPQQAELINGVLSLREGQDFFARREVAIRFAQPVQGAVRLDVLPQDSGKLPEVEISWLLPDQELPEARRLQRGYTLHLDLQPIPPNKLAGKFHLVLPARFNTTLSGDIELFTNHLRYRNGGVDTHFDSSDTLAHVIGDYLQRRFSTQSVQLADLPPVRFPTTRLPLNVEARIDGRTQQLALVLDKSDLSGWRVVDDHYPALADTRAAPPSEAAGDKPATSQEENTFDRRLRFSLERLLRMPDHYLGLSMRIQLARGGMAEGRFLGIEEDGSLRIRRNLKGAGEASFTLRPDDIARIELLEP